MTTPFVSAVMSCQIKNMADAAAARREARRRRILENSQNRLQLISGKKSSDECAKETPSNFLFSEQNYEFPGASSSDNIYYPPTNNGVLVIDTESSSALPEVQDSIAAGDTEVMNDLASLLSPSSAETMKVSSTWDKLMSYKYDVALLALFNQLLYLLTYESAYFFLPLIVYTATRLVWFPSEKKSSIANAVLLLNGMSSHNVQLILNFTQYLAEVTQDLFVYLFVTICIQSLFVFLKESIFTY